MLKFDNGNDNDNEFFLISIETFTHSYIHDKQWKYGKVKKSWTYISDFPNSYIRIRQLHNSCIVLNIAGLHSAEWRSYKSCKQACLCTCMCASIYVCIYYVCVCVDVLVYVYLYVCVCVYNPITIY